MRRHTHHSHLSFGLSVLQVRQALRPSGRKGFSVTHILQHSYSKNQSLNFLKHQKLKTTSDIKLEEKNKNKQDLC